ncbi:hypothetical protein [Mitsuaria sp. GD03876]|uniref:hypothetical protein n=1 Tax=Mitsuaria sp. GD03876 TaxID=2975399 RepID=UPI00244C248C|nr:hypothetical protein [Mitsuaria sp. GD03876]MDH0865337.1 hypothetical protein [Mitsuaria sp. GD03876]
MTSITPTQRLLHSALSNSQRMSDEMERLTPEDIGRAVGIQQRQQVNMTTMKTSIQLHRHIERKILNEQR